MSNMSSFYGGRSGASFILVKRFDGISFTEDKYTKTYYAIDINNKLVLVTDSSTEGAVAVSGNKFLIKKTANNFNSNNYNWKLFENKGQQESGAINNNPSTPITMPTEKAESMLDCFSKGTSSLNIVNYLEYVIIDTVTNLNEYSNPDNGKIYRRGFDINNGMAGAEYIGRIVGPQGFNTGIQLKKYDEIDGLTNPYIKSDLSIQDSDLLSGKEHNTIQCISANYEDVGGNILNTIIGFKFPYLVNEFQSELVEPYNLPDNLISEIRKENNNTRPFFKEWNIKIPKGVKGDSLVTIRVQPTIAPSGISYYSNEECTNKVGTLNTNTNLTPSSFNPTYKSFSFEIDSTKVYVKASDCIANKVYYIIKNYDRISAGDPSDPIEVGDIKSIVESSLDRDGTLKFYYDNGEIETAQNKIKWITSSDIDNNSKLVINYNNGTKDTISKAINYINGIYIATKDDQKSNKLINPKNLYIQFSDPDKNKEGIEIPGKDGKWNDYGSLEPPSEGIKIAGGVKYEELKDNVPPEKILGEEFKGYSVVIDQTIYYYDYREKEWVNGGAISENNITNKIVRIDSTKPNSGEMYTHGIWMVTSSIFGR